jgi:multidrug efflux pump subunit AcrB
MVPVKTLVTLKRTFGPETVTRNNLFNAVTINGTPKPGYSTGDAIKSGGRSSETITSERLRLRMDGNHA